MSYNSASDYWRARKERDNARKARRQAVSNFSRVLDSYRCSECKGPLTATGYCINDMTACSKAYTD